VRNVKHVTWAALVVLAAACGSAQHRRAKPTDGAIAGLVRDATSGEPLSSVDLQLVDASAHALAAVSGRTGLYAIDPVKPGRYTLHATYAGQPVTIKNIDIVAGEASYVDVMFTLGNPEPLSTDYSASSNAAISRYHPPQGAPLLEGTVSDATTRMRIAGAVVTAIGPNNDTLQTVSDDQGRFKFAPIPPGSYTVSAYYSVGGRGQIEIRRSDITVDASEGVIVPLWIETTKQ
jgi:hypothetical protein